MAFVLPSAKPPAGDAQLELGDLQVPHMTRSSDCIDKIRLPATLALTDPKPQNIDRLYVCIWRAVCEFSRGTIRYPEDQQLMLGYCLLVSHLLQTSREAFAQPSRKPTGNRSLPGGIGPQL